MYQRSWSWSWIQGSFTHFSTHYLENTGYFYRRTNQFTLIQSFIELFSLFYPWRGQQTCTRAPFSKNPDSWAAMYVPNSPQSIEALYCCSVYYIFITLKKKNKKRCTRMSRRRHCELTHLSPEGNIVARDGRRYSWTFKLKGWPHGNVTFGGTAALSKAFFLCVWALKKMAI